MRVYLICLISVTWICFSCGRDLPNSEARVKEIDSVKIQKPRNEKMNDTLVLDLKLESTIFEVKALVSGRVVGSDVDFKSPEKLDSVALIVSLDNRDAFLKLRKLKEELLKELKGLRGEVKSLSDLDRLLGLIRNDNLLPELNSTEFSEDFINEIKQRKSYSIYNDAKDTESSMQNYFYINEKPCYLNNILVQAGDFVKKGDVLYEYLSDNELTYRMRVSFSKDDILRIYDNETNKDVVNYQIKADNIYVFESIKKRVKKNKKITILLKRQIS